MKNISQQAKKIANEVKNSQKPQTFKMVDGNAKSMIALIEELAKLNLVAELVTISGTTQGLYVEPNDNMVDVGEIIPEVSINPFISNRVILCQESTSIEKIEYVESSQELIVNFKSKPEIPDTYLNVPVSEFEHLKHLNEGHGSVGSYVSRVIKPKYSFFAQEAE